MARRAYVGSEPTKGFSTWLGRDPADLSPAYRSRLASAYEADLTRGQATGHPTRGEAPARVVRAVGRGRKGEVLVGDLPRSDPQARTHVNVAVKDPKTGKWTYYRVPKRQARAVIRRTTRTGQAGPLTGFFGYVILKMKEAA
jgi:hypothetical protein